MTIWMMALLLNRTLHATPVDVPAGLALCEDRILRYVGPYETDARRQLLALTEREPLSPPLLIEFLAGHPRLEPSGVAELFDESVAVKEELTLREHVRMYLDVWRGQEDHYRDRISTKHRALVLVAALLHDIGKPLVTRMFCVSEGRPPSTREDFKRCSADQMTYTLPQVATITTVLGFAPDEVRLMTAFVDGDPIGAVVTERATPTEILEKFTVVARELDVPLAEFFAMKSLMYVSDAASYPGLRYGRGLSARKLPPVFVETADGRLVPIAPAFHELARLVAERGSR